MEELVEQIGNDTGIPTDSIRSALILVFKYLDRDGPPEQVSSLLDAFPGTREAIAESPARAPSTTMGAFMALTGAGIGMGELKPFAKSFGRIARARAGTETVDQIVASIPGLGAAI